MLKQQKPFKRGAGILIPVASLPSPYGIGTFGKAAYELLDFLRAAGQSYWQVLPLGPTSYGDSPYQSFSAFAGNPYYIDLDMLIEEGLLDKEEVEAHPWGDTPDDVDYGTIYKERFKVLRLACSRSNHATTKEYKAFCAANGWLTDYALFMALKEQHQGEGWQSWEPPLRMREPAAIAESTKALATELDFWRFCQYKFFQQWDALVAYAHNNGIEIIGDIPIYVAMDSADVWVNSHLFRLDEARNPVAVSGVPPDMFSATGQLWGNPLYDWDRMEQEGFVWWQQRMAASARLYDIIRIDHFIGIVNFYSIPAEDDTAAGGHWVEGPGEKLLEAITPALGGKHIVAEDLGVLTPAVKRLRQKSGYPGMKLMQFAFDSDANNEFLPCHFDKNTVIYGGTHDNETLVGYFSTRKRKELRFAREYLRVKRNSEIPWALICAGYESSANTAIYQLQDLMGLDNHARINTPSTLGQNWRWRLLPGQLSNALAEKINAATKLYGRCV
ncbi:MAG: 4-alpha-glucanotransferase [Angelakisella sp.]